LFEQKLVLLGISPTIVKYDVLGRRAYLGKRNKHCSTGLLKLAILLK